MRYVNPKDYNYVSQFVQMPLEYMNKSLTDKQEGYDKQLNELTEAQKEANLKGGYQTQELAKKTAETYKNKISELSTQLTSGNIPGGINKITSLRNEFNNNPDVQTIRYDEQARALAEKQHLDPTFAESVQNYYDPKAGYVQRKSGETFSPEWYKLYKPTDFVADHKDFYSYLKDNLRKTGETIGYEYKEDAEGNPIGWFQKNSNTFVRGITEDDVAPIAGKYASNPENAASHESAIYLNQKKLKEQGAELTTEEYRDELLRNYPGYHSSIETTESEKQLTSGKKDGATKKSSGNGQDDLELNDRLSTIMESTAASETKSSTLTSKDMSAMYNGTPNKDGTFTANMTNRPTYLQIDKNAVNGKNDAEKNMKLTSFVTLKAKENKIKKTAEKNAKAKIGLVFSEAPNDWNPFNETLPRSTKTVDGKYYIVNLGQDNIALQDVNTPPGFRPTKRMSKDEFIAFETQNGLNVEKQRDAKGKPMGHIALLEDEAKKEGFDLSDSKMLKESEKYINDESANHFVTTIQNLAGNRALTPSANKNGFMNDNGEFITSNVLTISEDEASELFGSDYWFGDWGYKHLEDLKLIKPRKVQSGEGTNKTEETVYDIPIFNKIDDNVADLSERVNSSNYQAADGSQAEWFNKQIPNLRQKSLDTHAKLKAQLQREKASELYEGKDAKIVDADFSFEMRDVLKNYKNSMINDGKTNEEIKNNSDAVLKEIRRIHDLPTNTKEQKVEKARQMFDIKLLLNDPKTYNSIKGLSDKDVGKQTPQSSKDNPLGI